MSSMADSISGATEARRTAKDREGEESKREKGKVRENQRENGEKICRDFGRGKGDGNDS